MLGVGNVMDISLHTSEADSVAIASIKADSVIKSKIGTIDSIQLTFCSLSSKNAVYKFILHTKNFKIKARVLLSYREK
jgi:hypothetical protein